VNDDSTSGLGQSGRGGRNKKKISYAEEEEKSSAAPGADGIAKFKPWLVDEMLLYILNYLGKCLSYGVSCVRCASQGMEVIRS
jgi:hypothetical protein